MVAVSLTGCGGDQDGAVRDAARDFYAALADGDGATACTLLAPATRSSLEQSSSQECPEAVLAEHLPHVGGIDEVSSFGTMAQLKLDGDTVFLARFRSGWRVMAAGCAPQPVGPYDCRIEGS